MKKYLAILILPLFTTAFNACDQEQPGISGESIITGAQNGTRWEAPAGGTYHSGMDTVNMSGWLHANENKVFSESIVFSNVPFQTGKYPLDNKKKEGNPGSTFYTRVGLDVPNRQFYMDEASENFIEVKIADSESQTISGTFNAVYIRDPKDTVYYPYLPDTLRFTDGFFRVKLKTGARTDQLSV